MGEGQNNGNRDRLPESPPGPTYKLRDVVEVISDTTPGCLRVQGTARVTAVGTDTGGAESYNVEYIHGGSAKGLPVTTLAPSAHGGDVRTTARDIRAAVKRPRARHSTGSELTETGRLHLQLRDTREQHRQQLANRDEEIRRLRVDLREARQREQDTRAAVRKVEALLQEERIKNEAKQAQMMSSIDKLLAGAEEWVEHEHHQKLAELSAKRKHQERNYKKRVAALQKDLTAQTAELYRMEAGCRGFWMILRPTRRRRDDGERRPKLKLEKQRGEPRLQHCTRRPWLPQR